MKMSKLRLAALIGILGAITLRADAVTQDFDGFTLSTIGSAPVPETVGGWTINDTYIATNLYTITPHDGTKFALLLDSAISGVSGTNSFVRSPGLTNGVGTVSFHLRNRPTRPGPFVCELQTSPNGTNWLTVATITNTVSDSWTRYDVNLDSYETVYLRFIKGSTANASFLAIDAISATEAPAKLDISGLAISPSSPVAGEAVSVSALLAPSALASNINATLYWSANGGSSNTISMATNTLSGGRYETVTPITNQPAFTVINYTVHVAFNGPYALSPQTASGSFFFRQPPPQSAYDSVTARGGLTNTLALVEDGHWSGIQSVGALGTTDLYFQTVAGMTTNRWSDPDPLRTNLPVFGAFATNAAADIRIASTVAGWLLLTFDENIGRYGVQQADYQSFNTWTSYGSYGTYTNGGWILRQGRAINTAPLAFEGYSVQFQSTTSERAIESPELTNGIGTIAFRYRNTETNGASPAAFVIQVRPASGDWSTVETVENIISPDYLYHSYTVASLDQHYVRIAALSGTAAAQLLIDDIVITRPGATVAFSGLGHTPTNPTILETVDVSVDITALNGAELGSVTLWFAAADLSYSMPITFTNFSGRGTLTDFPALINLTTANTGNYAGFLDTVNGRDLRFWSGAAYSGNELPYEIESFNGSGTSYIWVKVPALAHNATIWATWGNSGYNSQAGYTTDGSVWTAGYRGVWHLDAAVNGTTAQDSTAYGNNGTIQDPPGAVAQSGLIHNGYYCDGDGALNNGGPVIAGNATSLRVNAMTISGWFNDTASSERNGYISKGKTAVGLGYSNWELYSGADGKIGFAATEEDDTQAWSISGGTSGGGWRHVSAVWDGTTSANAVKVYVDGAVVVQGTAAGTVLANDRDLYLGAQSASDSTNPTFKGTMDEIRLASAAKSANWIWAEYMNQGARHNEFVGYGVVGVSASYSADVYDDITMTNTSGNTYRATIPRGARDRMLYYVEATYLNPASGGFPAASFPLDSTGSPATYTNIDTVANNQIFGGFSPSTIGGAATPQTVDGWSINDTYISTGVYTISPHAGTNFALLLDSAISGVSGTNSFVRTPELSNGVGTVSFYLQNRPTRPGPFVCELQSSFDGVNWVTVETFISTNATGWSQYKSTLDIYEPVHIRILKGGEDTANASFIAIDSISLTYPPAYVTASDFELHPAYPSQEETNTVACTIESATVFHPAFNISGTLRYRVNGGGWTSVAMSRSGSLFQGLIPPQLSLDEVEYEVEAGFKGYSAEGEDRSPMTFPEAPLEYTVRRYISDYDRMNIRIGTNEVADFVQLGNGMWEGVLDFVTPATNHPAFGIDGYGFYNGTNVLSGFTGTWGDNNQFRTNLPLAGTATIGALPILIPEYAEGQYIVRFDEATGVYSVQRAAFQDFENWPADETLFGESYAAAIMTQHTQPFETWELSNPNLSTASFEVVEGWTNAYAYPTNWVIDPDGKTSPNSHKYVIQGAVVVTQLVGQAALLDTSVGEVRIQSDFAGDTGSFAFDLRCADPNDFRPAIYSSLTNETIMISAKIKATDMPTNSALNSIGYAYTSIIGAYSNTNNYFELRIVQTAASNRRFEIWQKSGGTLTRRSFADDNGNSITKEDTVSLLMYRTTGQWTLKAFLNGNTNPKVNTTSSAVLTGKGIGLNAMDASVSVDWVNVYGISSANYSAANEIYAEAFTNSPPVGWNSSSGAWTVSGGRYTRKGYTGTPLTARVDSSTDLVYWTTLNDFTILSHSDYRRYTVSPHNPTNIYVRVRNLSGSGYMIVDNVERVAWRGKTVDSDGWFATNVWVDAIGKTGRGIELRNSRALDGADQAILSPTLTDGASVISFDYKPAPGATGAVAFAIEYEDRATPDVGIWNHVTAVTNSSNPTNWVPFSHSIADRDLRPEISRIRILNLTPGHDDGLRLDNITVTEPVPINDTTWWGYNVLVTSKKPTGIVDSSASPWRARLAGNGFGAFINNSTTNGTGGTTHDEYAPFIQSAYLPDGIGEIRFLYRAWDTNSSQIQVIASTNRLTPENDWVVLDSVSVTSTAFSEYYNAIFERGYTYVALRVNSRFGNLGRVGVENILITAPLAADLRLSNLRTIPDVPLPGDDVYVEVTVDDLFFSPHTIELQLLHKTGTNTWGDHSGSVAYAMYLVEDHGDSLLFRSSQPILPKAIDTVVQYQVKATFEGFFSEKSSPKYYRSFASPDHYWPVDLNRDHPANTNTPYYIVFSCLPGQVWINELNVADDQHGLYPAGPQFVELVGVGNAPIRNWRIEVINPSDFSTNSSYAITNVTTIGSALDAYGFYVLGDSTVTNRNLTLTNTLPESAGVQLVRSMGAFENQVCYDVDTVAIPRPGADMTNLIHNQRYAYAGVEQTLFVSYSLSLAGSDGSNSTGFAWSNAGDFNTIGSTNTGQTLIPWPTNGPVFPGEYTGTAAITSAWRNTGLVYFDVSTQATNLVPSVWYTTNLLNITSNDWQQATDGFVWSRSGTDYTVWCNEIPPPVFYRIGVSVAP